MQARLGGLCVCMGTPRVYSSAEDDALSHQHHRDLVVHVCSVCAGVFLVV